MKFDELITERLIIRRLERPDLDALCRYRSDPEVSRYQFWDRYEREDAIKLLESQKSMEPDVPDLWFSVVLEQRETGKVIGDFAMRAVGKASPRTFGEWEGQTEIGFNVAASHQRRGYGREATARVLDFLFGDMGRHRVTAITDTRNAACIGLLENLGFRREGHFVQNVWFKGEWGDEYLYAILADEWERKRADRA
jgi:RimJ/RimL family protein N-acetyltransferase